MRRRVPDGWRRFSRDRALQAYSGTLQYELPAAALLLLLVWPAPRAVEAVTTARAALAALTLGAAAGIAGLTREVLLAVVTTSTRRIWTASAATPS